MRVKPVAGAGRPQPAWAMWLPGVAAFTGAVLLAAGWFLLTRMLLANS